MYIISFINNRTILLNCFVIECTVAEKIRLFLSKLTSCAGMTVPRTSSIFSPKIASFSQFQVYFNVSQTKQMISLLLLNHFHPVILLHRRDSREKKKATNYCIRFGHSLRSANQLPAQRSKILCPEPEKPI